MLNYTALTYILNIKVGFLSTSMISEKLHVNQIGKTGNQSKHQIRTETASIFAGNRKPYTNRRKTRKPKKTPKPKNRGFLLRKPENRSKKWPKPRNRKPQSPPPEGQVKQ